MKRPLLLLLVSAVLAACAATRAETIPSRRTLAQADTYLRQLHYDKAMELYRSLSDAYDLPLSKEQRQVCLDAVLGCCDINMQRGNYPAAFENLLLAEDIAGRDGLPDMPVHVRYGAMYVIMAQQTVNADYLRKTISHDSIALPEALRRGDDMMIYRSFGDMTLSHSYFGTLDRMEPFVRQLRQYADTSRSWRPRAALYMYSYARAMGRHDYSDAAAVYDSALNIVPRTVGNARVRASYYKTKALAQTFGTDYPGACESLRHALELSYRHGLKDIRLACLPILSDVYTRLGENDRAWRTKVHMLELRDSLRTWAVAEDLHRMEMNRQRRDMQSRMAVAEYRAREKDRLLVIVSSVAVLILIFTLRLRNRNRRLREHSALLYERMRQLYRSRPETLSQTEPATTTSPENKYENSTLTDDDKKEIKESILHVMDTDAIYSPDLTLNSFSNLVGRHPKAVSQVIHEEFDCNFSAYINRARIVEACRRVDMPQYTKLSMEAIGESVGFNSRTTFSVNFRRFTGLGLRAYRQTAQQHRDR